MADKDHTIKNLRAAFKAERKIGQGHVSHLMDDEGHKRKATDVEQNNGHPNTHKKKLTSREVMGRIGTTVLAPGEYLETLKNDIKDAATHPGEVIHEAATEVPRNLRRAGAEALKTLPNLFLALIGDTDSLFSSIAKFGQAFKELVSKPQELIGLVAAPLREWFKGTDYKKFGSQAPEGGAKKNEPTAPAAPTAGNPNINIPVSAAMNLTPDSPRGSQSSSRER
ncbi:MAG: hypothetical protein K0R63_962 [Rickettsiales bacterium]|jgi:hypothetical protein|nr:hypothetical protein [Rickettsiales bacterium]